MGFYLFFRFFIDFLFGFLPFCCCGGLFQFCTSYDLHVTGPYAVCSRVITDLFSDFAKPFTSAFLRDFKSECS